MIKTFNPSCKETHVLHATTCSPCSNGLQYKIGNRAINSSFESTLGNVSTSLQLHRSDKLRIHGIKVGYCCMANGLKTLYKKTHMLHGPTYLQPVLERFTVQRDIKNALESTIGLVNTTLQLASMGQTSNAYTNKTRKFVHCKRGSAIVPQWNPRVAWI